MEVTLGTTLEATNCRLAGSSLSVSEAVRLPSPANHTRKLPASSDEDSTLMRRLDEPRRRSVSGTATRWERLPDVPWMADFVPGYEASGWFGVGEPGIRRVEITNKLHKGINAGLADPKLKRNAGSPRRLIEPRHPISRIALPSESACSGTRG
jgi:hypothetical protein